ncbi:hypothetical protein [uncultured Nevskia sp.]|uniref:hypothetical protein n=1 Tax=uncultured Nevskia sp. TaxID=228950 RepID=UPI0025E10233|nr:hypothetical protein [uncultured Nevskia sp.]
MSDRDADHAAQRQRVLARIEHDRQQLAGTIDELRRPLHTLHQLQKNTRAIVPALFAAGAAFLILRAVRGSNRNRRIDKALAGVQRSHYPVVQAKRSTSWFAWVLKFVSAYRIAMAVSETVRSVSHAAGSGPQRSIGAIGSSAGTTGYRSAGSEASRSHPTLERNPT